MDWLWIILRALFPRDPIRQGAEAIRQRVVQLMDMANDGNWLRELLTDPALRLHIELIILDAEDTLRLWIAMRGCQIAGIRLGVPHERAIPNLTRAKDLPELLARIYELLDACEKMEQRAQAHAERLKRQRDADPLGLNQAVGCIEQREMHHRATSAVAESFLAKSETACRAIAQRRREGAGRNAAGSLHTHGPPHSIAGANP